MLNPRVLTHARWRAVIHMMEDRENLRLSGFTNRVAQGNALRNLLRRSFPDWYATIGTTPANIATLESVLRVMASGYQRERLEEPDDPPSQSFMEVFTSVGVQFSEQAPTATPTQIIMDEEFLERERREWVSSQIQPPAPPAPTEMEAPVFRTNPSTRAPRVTRGRIRRNFPDNARERAWRSATRRIADVLANAPAGAEIDRRIVQTQVSEVLTDELWDMFQFEVGDVLEYLRHRKEHAPRRFVDESLEEMWKSLSVVKRHAFNEFASRTHAVYGNMGVTEKWPTDNEMFEYWIKQNPPKEEKIV